LRSEEKGSSPTRRHGKAALPVRMPLFPWLQLVALGLLAAILVTMGLDEEFWRLSWIVGVPWLALISIAYFVWRPRRVMKPSAELTQI
jgi:L-asparagine transporter-like permease